MASRGVDITTDKMAHLLRNKAKENGCKMLLEKIVCLDFKVTLPSKQL